MENIHDLVHSLTISEKRYFKIFCERHVIGMSNKSVDLFDLVAGQRDYDEAAIMRKLPFASTPEKLKKHKYRLQQLILKSMGFYHASATLEMEVIELVQQAQFLYSKGHYQLCLRILDKGLSKSEALEKNAATELLLDWRRRALIRLSDLNGVVESIAWQQQVATQTSAGLSVMHTAFTIHRWVNHKGIIRTQEEAEQLQAMMNELQVESHANQTFYSAYYMLSAKGIAYSALSEHEKQLECNRSIVQLFLERPQFIDDWSLAFISSVGNLCNAYFAQVRLQDHRDTWNLLIWLRERGVDTNNRNVQLQLELTTFSHGLVQLMYSGDLLGAKKSADAFVDGYQAEFAKLSVFLQIQLFYDLAYLNFLNADFGTCQHWLNRILNNDAMRSRSDLFGFAELMNILVHFEREHGQLVTYLEHSLSRRLLADDRLYPVERLILRLLRQLINESDRKIINTRLGYVISKFRIMQDDPYEKDVWQYFDFISWLEAKRSGRKMKDVFKERMAGLWKR